ncbi:choice-of-anchor J domain-containing protein [uncultured Winogradskyella sp.]|uniref:T9SS type A sorting domain-containing protein n=1 Tax=uncultured Winogradskyella sp. TaxID=395353 RepID=UPI0035150931
MKKIIILIALITSTFAQGQSTIYSEDFTGQEGQGASGPGGSNPNIDLSLVNWSIDVSNASFANTNDYFSVINVGGNAIFEGRDLDTEAIWFSPLIDISNFFDVSFSLEVSESNGTGGNNLEPNDTVTIEYRIDGGAWTQANTNGSFSNDFDATISSQDLLNGSTLELRVIMRNNGGGERMRIDNITVSGFENCTAFALPFSEDFEGGVFPPPCWNSYRGANGLGTANDWTTSTLVANSGTTSAFVEYEVVSGGNAQDWLVTPAIDLGTAQAQLRFFAREQFTIDYNTEYTIRVSQTSQTDISSFTTLQTYNEAQLGSTFNEKTVDLSAYSGVVYIAFVMEQNDGDNWFLDDVSIVDISGCSTPLDVSNATATYVDGNIDLNWTLSSCYDEVLVVAREESPVTAVPSGDGSNYFASTNFGSGTEISTDEFIVFKGTQTNVEITNVSFGSTYHFEIFTRKGSNWSAGIPLSITLDYCAVDGDTTFETSITLVNFGSINNATGQGSGYDDFTAIGTTVARGSSENLTVNINTDGNVAIYSYAWIDWNQDGDFDDPNETYDLGATIDSPDGPTANSPLAISIPNDAVLGDTRLRVLCQYYFFPIPTNGPCDGSTDGEIEDYTITVVPGTSYVYDNGWSPANPNGIATFADDITIVNGDATIDTNTNCNTLIVEPGAGLIVTSGTTLELLNTLTLESNSTQYSSLILDGNLTGTVTYNRHVNDFDGTDATTAANSNDLVSPPTAIADVNVFLTGNSNLLSQLGAPTLYAFAPFNNDSGVYENFDSNATGPLTRGVGYRAATSSPNQTLSFTGSVATNQVDIGITVGSATNSTEAWNLIGNPFPSYLDFDAFFTANKSEFEAPSFEAIYGYNATAARWTIWNQATIDDTSETEYIAPGQGFFVKSKTGGGMVSFTPAMRTTAGSDDFIAGRSASSVSVARADINLQSEGKDFNTIIYFNSNATRGMDPGYDASAYLGNANGIFTHLVEGNTGIELAVQTLDYDDYNDVVIPVGVKANQGQQITFSLGTNTLPAGTKVYLDDTVANTVTELTMTDYIVTPATALNGTGRFFLRFESNALSNPEAALDGLSIFTAEKTIVIAGQLNENTTASVFDLQGRLVKQVALDKSLRTQTISTNGLSSGVYVVQLSNSTQSKTEKVILN